MPEPIEIQPSPERRAFVIVVAADNDQGRRSRVRLLLGGQSFNLDASTAITIGKELIKAGDTAADDNISAAATLRRDILARAEGQPNGGNE